ncbi:MAG: hypothetical protein H3C34_21680 [Caldilineaceae bacterium]|nr:hypothetical protein [Caldilineaceae bacterium]
MTPTLRRVVLAVLLGHFILGVAYSAANPLGEAPDEADHFAYVLYLANKGTLPVGPKVTQSKHPPLYHATAAIWSLLGAPNNLFLRSNPDVQLSPSPGWSPNFFIHTTLEAWPWRDGALAMHMVRLWSVILSTATVAATYLLARRALPGQPAVAVAAAGLLAFMPEFLFIGSSVNNDNAAALFGTLSLAAAFTMARAGGRYRPGWWGGLVLGAGLLSKVSTVALWPAVGLAVLAGVLVEARGSTPSGWWPALLGTWRRWLPTLVWTGALAAVIALPWFVRNWLLYGDPSGMALVMATIDQRTAAWGWNDTWWLLRGWFLSFWGKFGGAGHVPMPAWVYALAALFTAVCAAGLIRLFLRPAWRAARWPVTLLLLATASVAIGVWRYSLLALGTDQGRLLYPVAGALVVLLAAGLLAWLPEGQQRRGAYALIAASFLLGIYALGGVIRPAYAPPAPLPAGEPALAAPSEVIDFGDLSLVGWVLAPAPTLYWRVDEPTAIDWRLDFRLLADDGTLVWERRRSPGAGRWSTDHWPVGVLVEDSYGAYLPSDLAPGKYLVEVGVRPFGGELETLPDGRAYAVLGWFEVSD